MSRVEKLYQKLRKNHMEGLLLTNTSNIFYLFGVRIQGAVLVTPEKNFFIISPMYKQQMEEKNRGWEIVVYETKFENALQKVGKKVGIRRCGFESNHLSFAVYKRIEKKLKPQLVPCNNLVENIRVIKEKEEVSLIGEAGRITMGVFPYLKGILQVGISEREALREVVNYILNKAEGIAFYPIVLFGERTSLPHGEASQRKLKKNDLVLIDAGAKVDGYCADITRTFVWGKPSNKWERVHSFVEQMKEKVIGGIKPGIKVSDIDQLFREEGTKQGYEKQILHGIGHGVGIDVHEEPAVSRTSDATVEEGMVLTVEPGVYFPEEGGVRSEDMVLVTNRGGRILP